MKKRLFGILLVLVLIVGLVPVAALAMPDAEVEYQEVEVYSNQRVQFNFSTLIAKEFETQFGTPFIGGATVIGFRDNVESFRGNTVPGTGRQQWTTTIGTATEFRFEVIFPSGLVFSSFHGPNILRPVVGNPSARVITSQDIINSPFFNPGYNHFQINVNWEAVPGTYTPQPPRPQPPLSGTPFTDVRENAWYANSVRFVYQRGIMSGINPTTFAPNTNFSREMVLATQFRMANGRPANASDPRNTPFTDVGTGRWYAPYVAWAFNNGLTTGTSPTTFGTGQAVSRQDFALFMYRFAQSQGIDTNVPGNFNLNFPDANRVGSWAQDALRWAVYEGLITGVTTGGGQTLEPGGTATRAQSATILMRYVQNT